VNRAGTNDSVAVTNAQASLVRIVVDLLYNVLYVVSKLVDLYSTTAASVVQQILTNGTSGV